MKEAGQYKQEGQTFLCIYPMLLLVYLCGTDSKIDPQVCLTQEHVPFNSLKGIKYTKQVWGGLFELGSGDVTVILFSDFWFFVFSVFIFCDRLTL